jgi:hypothetical protein
MYVEGGKTMGKILKTVTVKRPKTEIHSLLKLSTEAKKLDGARKIDAKRHRVMRAVKEIGNE